MIKVSFILPCYNVERYVADCLDSIYAQGLPEDEFEVICVNDSSTDSTRSIIADYGLRHSNLILIDHTQNMNVGAARNSGMEVAKGEYIWFVDPDDLIERGCLKNLYETAHEEETEVLMFNYCVVDENLVEMPQYSKCGKVFVDSPVMSGQDFVMTYTPNRMSEHCIVWRCLFNNVFLKRNGLTFPLMSRGEDVSFMWRVLLCAKKVRSISKSSYIYRSNSYSIARRSREARVFFSARMLLANEIVGMLEMHSLNSQLRDEMMKTLEWCVNSNLEGFVRMSHQELKNYYNEIVFHEEIVKKLKPYMSRKSKMMFFIKGGERLWLCIVNYFIKKKKSI